MVEIPTICRYCGGAVHLVPAAKVYGPAAAKRLGLEREKFYQCQNCNARVGCHRQDMQLEEISLDCVIMSPEMLEPVPAREPESIGNQLTLTCLEDQIDHVDGVTLAISNDMGVLLRKMLENLEEYDDPPVLTRVEKTISGFLFAYGGRDNQEDGPCVVYIVSETPVLPAKNKEEMK